MYRKAIILIVLLAASPIQADQLRFEATYRGVFSALDWLRFAHVNYIEAKPIGAGDLVVSEVHASSERHGTLEGLYPIRYLARSLFDPESGTSIAFERYKKTRRVRYTLFRHDAALNRLMRYRPEIENPVAGLAWAAPTASLEPEDEGLDLSVGGKVVDQLALIPRIRHLDWMKTTHRFTATDGKRLLNYRATVVGSEPVDWRGESVPVWKIRLEGFRGQGMEDDGSPHHAPVYLWLTRDSKRLPLRVEHRHFIGMFRLEMLPSGSDDGPWIVPSVVDQSELADVRDGGRGLLEPAVLQ